MACPTVVVVGASAGGFEAVTAITKSLPGDLPLAVFVVIHSGPGSYGLLPQLLGHASQLPVAEAVDGEPIRPGHIYIAPLDRHVLLEDGHVRLWRGPKQHGFRPAVDPLFVSAAQSYGPCAIGVVLSGALDDGTAGLLAIKQGGGAAIVQDPEEAAFPSMPLNALRNVAVDAVLPLRAIGDHLVRLAREGKDVASGTGSRRRERAAAAENPGYVSAQATGLMPPAVPGGAGTLGGSAGETRTLTALTCPSCGGALWEVEKKGVDQYECHVGHRYGPEALLALENERLEDTLWSAVRTLKEHGALRRRMAQRAHGRGMNTIARTWQAQAAVSEARADKIRGLIEALSADGDGADGRPPADERDDKPRGNGQRPRSTKTAKESRAASARRGRARKSR